MHDNWTFFCQSQFISSRVSFIEPKYIWNKDFHRSLQQIHSTLGETDPLQDLFNLWINYYNGISLWFTKVGYTFYVHTFHTVHTFHVHSSRIISVQ